MPSLELLRVQVATERETLNRHVESLDAKAGIVLGFSGVLVGLGATANSAVANTVAFQMGLGFAVLAAVLAVTSFFPTSSYPVLRVGRIRQSLTAQAEETSLALLDTQIDMVNRITRMLARKGRRVRLSVSNLATAAFLVVLGTLLSGGPR
jgi:hypothetical protein